MKMNIALISAAACFVVGAPFVIRHMTKQRAMAHSAPVVEAVEELPYRDPRELDRLALAIRQTERREAAERAKEERQSNLSDVESTLASFAWRQERVIEDLEERLAELEAENTRLREEQEEISVRLEQMERRDPF